MDTGARALQRVAPDAADALDAVVAATWVAGADRGFLGTVLAVAGRNADLLATPPLGPPRVPDPTGGSEAGAVAPAVLSFAEQCTLDVASVTDDQRAEFLAVAGPASGDLAAALWVVDLVPRTRAALDALFGAGPWPAPSGGTGDLWGALDRLIRVVPALDALDPVTSELVRLRGARQHDCRLCRSLRSRPALRAGADDDTFAAVDHYADSDLPPLARAALAFTDAMLWTPGRIGPTTLGDLREVATPAQQVELVLDVTRNALNKIAVGLGADAAHVEDGVEIYDVAPDGSLVYGLDPD
jgi:hypothetical protein